MKVLSLFDGMSCGRIALDQLGIPVEKYYASEVDKYAMQVSAANYPDIIQVGDVCDLDPKDYMDVDLIQAGSPCQGFSMAGKQLAFDDPRSALFFEFIRLLKAIKPKYFLLENVRMKKEFLDVITEQVSACYEADDVAPEFKTMLGDVTFVPHFINASLVSAQSRQRYYWTNIPGIKQPEDRGIVLRDILEQDPSEIYQISEAKKDRVLNAKRGKGFFYTENDPKIGTVVAGYHKEPTDGSYIAQHKPVKDTPRNRRHVRGPDEKSLCMTATMYKGAGNNGMTLVPHKPIKVGMNVEEVKVRKHEVDIPGLQTCILDHYAKCGKNKKEIAKELNDKYSTVEHYFRKLGSDFFSIPSEEHWPQLKEILGITTDKFDKQIMEFEYRDGVFESTQRVYSDQGKSPTLTASNKEQMIETTTSDNGITNIKKGTSGKSWFFEQQTYSKDSKKTRSLKSSSGSGNIPKVIETKPKQVGVAVDIKGHDQIKRVYSPEGKSPTVTTCGGGHREPKVVTGGAFRGRAYDKNGKRMDKNGVPAANKTKQMLELRNDNKSNATTTVGKDSVVAHEDLTWRKLTPLECERLQTVPDNYTDHVSNTQRYKMLGNGWTVEVIKHIFKNMEIE